MPNFVYRAVTAGGEVIEGRREDADQASVVRWLQRAGYIPLSAELFDRQQRGASSLRWLRRERKVGRAEQSAIADELAVLLKAGVPLEQALQIARNATTNPAGARLLAEILEGVRGGMSFSVALESEGRSFSPLFINIVRTAEASGRLDQGLEQLSEYLQREKALRDEIVSATLYPLILFGVAIISIGLILTYVIPRISELFVGYEDLLPLSTTVIISSAEFVSGYWWLLLLLLLAALLLLRQQLAKPDGRLRWDRRLLRMPYLGDLIAKVEVARFSRGMATLLGNGVPLIVALPLACRSLTNTVLVADMTATVDELKDGGRLSDALAGLEYFPALARQLVRVGEETGDLDGMLAKVAAIYESETNKAAKRLLAVLEPVLIVGLGVVIGAIIMSIMVAIISVNELPL